MSTESDQAHSEVLGRMESTMKPSSPVLLAALVLAVLGCCRVRAQSPSDAQGLRTTKRLKMNVPGQVTQVILSVLRNDFCNVQIHFPDTRLHPGDPKAGRASMPFFRTQVWLLKSDGTSVPRTREPARLGVGNAGSGHAFVSYDFPTSACTEAVSVVLRVEDQFLVESLLDAKTNQSR
jgi:hypothetical protein